MAKKNPHSILLLYEGDTEEEFYKRIIAKKIPAREIRISYDNLYGISTNINHKVLDKLSKHLNNNPLETSVNVFVAIDREGDRTHESHLFIEKVKETISKESDSIASIYEIIATQDIESWFFIDIDGIFNFLKVPKLLRSHKKYRNYEGFNHRNLSNLFRQNRRSYTKGSNVKGFLDSLDLNKIYENCPDLKAGISQMSKLISNT